MSHINRNNNINNGAVDVDFDQPSHLSDSQQDTSSQDLEEESLDLHDQCEQLATPGKSWKTVGKYQWNVLWINFYVWVVEGFVAFCHWFLVLQPAYWVVVQYWGGDAVSSSSSILDGELGELSGAQALWPQQQQQASLVENENQSPGQIKLQEVPFSFIADNCEKFSQFTTQFNYQYVNKDHSAVSSFDLTCSTNQEQHEERTRTLESYRSIVGYLWFGGFLTGIFLLQPFADKKGRLPAIYIAMTIMTIGVTLSPMSWNFTSFAVSRLLQGFGAGPLGLLTFVMATELYSGDEKKLSIVNNYGTHTGMSVGGVIMCIVWKFCPTWRMMMWIVCVMTWIQSFWILFFLEESPRWLLWQLEEKDMHDKSGIQQNQNDQSGQQEGQQQNQSGYVFSEDYRLEADGGIKWDKEAKLKQKRRLQLLHVLAKIKIINKDMGWFKYICSSLTCKGRFKGGKGVLNADHGENQNEYEINQNQNQQNQQSSNRNGRDRPLIKADEDGIVHTEVHGRKLDLDNENDDSNSQQNFNQQRQVVARNSQRHKQSSTKQQTQPQAKKGCMANNGIVQILCTSPKLTWHTLVLAFLWWVTSHVYYGITFSSEGIQNNLSSAYEGGENSAHEVADGIKKWGHLETQLNKLKYQPADGDPEGKNTDHIAHLEEQILKKYEPQVEESWNFLQDVYFITAIMVLVETPALFFAMCFQDGKMGRRGTNTMFLIFTGAGALISCGLMMAFFTNDDESSETESEEKSNKEKGDNTIFLVLNVVILVLVVLAKLAIAWVFGIIYLIGTEMFPTEVRSVGMGICSTSARLGGLACSVVVNLDAITGMKGWSLIVFGSLSMVAWFLGQCVLPETLGREIVDKVSDYEDVCKRAALKDKEGDINEDDQYGNDGFQYDEDEQEYDDQQFDGVEMGSTSRNQNYNNAHNYRETKHGKDLHFQDDEYRNSNNSQYGTKNEKDGFQVDLTQQ